MEKMKLIFNFMFQFAIHNIIPQEVIIQSVCSLRMNYCLTLCSSYTSEGLIHNELEYSENKHVAHHGISWSCFFP